MKKHVILLMLCALVLSACGSSKTSVEDEVSRALLENGITVESLDDLEKPRDDAGNSGMDTDTEPVRDKDGDNAVSAEDTFYNDQKDSAKDTLSDKSKSVTDIKYENPYLGTASTATSYRIDFEIQTDSGVAGITWGATREHAGEAKINTDKIKANEKDEFYIAAFDCTREIPRFYFARYRDGYVFDESYTNLDFMFPEMVMFTDVQQIVEISVSGMGATVYLDSYKVCDLELDSPKPVGLIGTWISNGDYHAYIDNVFVAEGSEGDGDWIYSDDFSGRANLFSPNFKTISGRLYAEDGYYTTLKNDGACCAGWHEVIKCKRV